MNSAFHKALEEIRDRQLLDEQAPWHMAARTFEVIKTASIDDWEAPPMGRVMARVRQIHGLNKRSSWTEIGPVGNRDPGGQDPMKHVRFKKASILKTAEPPPPKGVSTKEWDKILQSRVRTNAIRDKLAYKLQGHTAVQGIPIAIENRKGSVRKGKDADGKPWRTKMKRSYGYIVGTKGADDEPVDAYVGPDKSSPNAFVVHQHKDTGKGYDEDKAMIAFPNKAAAKKAFLAHYNSPKFLGPISTVPIDRLKELIASKRKLVKISAKEKKPGRTMRLVRKAGPGVGGLVGAGLGAALGARRGKLLRGAIAGLGTGATIGWVPEMAGSAKEAIKQYRKSK